MAHHCATSVDYHICKKKQIHPPSQKKNILLMRLVFAGPGGSGGHYLRPSKNIITLYVFLNLTTVF